MALTAPAGTVVGAEDFISLLFYVASPAPTMGEGGKLGLFILSKICSPSVVRNKRKDWAFFEKIV
jgi:hypothetical protein